jgi:TRAP-type transport system small permease protein
MRTLEGLYRRLLVGLAAVAGLIFALTAVLIPVNVVLRAGFPAPSSACYDAIEFGLLAATFLAAPWVLARNAHVTVDIALMALSDRQRRRVGRLTNLLGAGLCAVFVYYSLTATLASAARGSMIRTSFVIPEWWVLSVMPWRWRS